MVCFVIIGMVNAQRITEFFFGRSTQLTSKMVTFSDACFQRFTKSWRILHVRYAPLPSRILFTAQGLGNLLQPCWVFRKLLSSLPCLLFHFWSPSLRHFLFRNCRPFLPLQIEPRFSLRRRRYFCTHFCRALVLSTMRKVYPMTRRTALDSSWDVCPTVNTRPLFRGTPCSVTRSTPHHVGTSRHRRATVKTVTFRRNNMLCMTRPASLLSVFDLTPAINTESFRLHQPSAVPTQSGFVVHMLSTARARKAVWRSVTFCNH